MVIMLLIWRFICFKGHILEKHAFTQYLSIRSNKQFSRSKSVCSNAWNQNKLSFFLRPEFWSKLVLVRKNGNVKSSCVPFSLV